MAWAKLDDAFAWNHKVVEAGNEAAGVYARALAHCGAQLTDGFVPEKVARAIADGRKPPIAALLEGGLWESVDGGYRIPDFLEYNPSRNEKLEERAAARERMRRVRANRQSGSAERSGEQAENFAARSATPTRPVPTRPDQAPTEIRNGGEGSPPEDQVREEFERWVSVYAEAAGSEPIPSELSLAEQNFIERRSEGVATVDLERAARVAAKDPAGLSASEALSRFRLGRLLAAPKPKKDGLVAMAAEAA